MSGDPGAGLPDPVPLVAGDHATVRLSGIGGTGVITVSQMLGTAAMLDGFVVRGLDQTGLSQKAGPVVSDLRLSRGEVPASNHANSAGVDCLLAFDLLVAASDTHRIGADAERTVVVGSVAVTPTGAMVAHPTTPYPQLDVLTGRLDEVSRRRAQPLPRQRRAGDGAVRRRHAANILLLGVAVQQGAIPVDAGLRRAGDRAQRRRRRPQRRRVPLGATLGGRPGARWPRRPASRAPVTPETLDELVERLATDLAGYQSASYARRFRDLVAVARSAEQRVDPDEHAPSPRPSPATVTS